MANYINVYKRLGLYSRVAKQLPKTQHLYYML